MKETLSLKRTRKEWNEADNKKRIELLNYCGIELCDNVCKAFDSLGFFTKSDLIECYEQRQYQKILESMS